MAWWWYIVSGSVDALQYGFTQGWRAPTNPDVRPLTAGSLWGPDAVLTSAFIEQFREIGWFHMCLGCVNTKWASAGNQYGTHPCTPDADLHWASILVAVLWRFSKSLWQYWNEVVHGATVEEQEQRQIASVREKMTSFYNSYAENPDMVLPRHQHLFTHCTLTERLGASYDNMSAWLRSVEQAILVLQHQEAANLEVSQLIFPSNQPETVTIYIPVYSTRFLSSASAQTSASPRAFSLCWKTTWHVQRTFSGTPCVLFSMDYSMDLQ